MTATENTPLMLIHRIGNDGIKLSKGPQQYPHDLVGTAEVEKRHAFGFCRNMIIARSVVVVFVLMMMMMMGIYVAFLAQTDNLRSSSTAFASLILAFFNHNGDHSNTGFVLKDTSCVNGTKVELDLHCSKGGEGGGSNNDGGTAAGQQTTICGFGDQAIITAKVTLSTTTAAAADGSAVLPTAIDIVGNACLFGSFLCKSIAFSDVVICDYMKGVTDGACPSSGNTYTGNFDFLLEGDPMFLGHWEFDVRSHVYDSSNSHSLLEICTTTVQTTMIDLSN